MTITDSITSAVADCAAPTPEQDEAIAHYREHGFCVLRNLFQPDEVEDMKRFDVQALMKFAQDDPHNQHRLQFKITENGEKTVQKIEGLSSINPEMGRWSNDPRLLAIAGEILGGPARLFKDKYILKPKGGGGFGAHQDMAMGFHRFTTGCVSIMIALDPADEENGCLQVAPIKHTPALVSRPEMALEKRLIPQDAWQLIPLNPGDVAIFDGLTPHRSAPNESERLRRVYITTYHLAEEGDLYDDYYTWFFDWKTHQANGGQRFDYHGVPVRRSIPQIKSFTKYQSALSVY